MEDMGVPSSQIAKLVAGFLYGAAWLLPGVAVAQDSLRDDLKSLVDKQPPREMSFSFSGQMPAPSSMRGLFLVQFLRPGPFERSLEEARVWFRSTDLDMNGVVAPADKEIGKDVWLETVWPPVIANILRHDLNFDGIVTRDEVFKAIDYRIRSGAYIRPDKENSEEALRRKIDQDVSSIMQADRDRDGRLDIQEIMAFARQTLPLPGANDYYQQVVLTMDQNGDGSVTLDEFNAHVEGMLRTIDSDGDASLSDNEIKAYRTQVIARPLKSTR